MAASDARPFPLRNTAYRVYFPILDADGDPVSGAANLDSEISKDAAAFADCTNEAVEIGASGMYYLDLTSTEIGTASAVVLTIKTTTSGAKTTTIVLYPVDPSVAQLGVNAVQAGGTTWGSGAITAGSIADNAIDAAALAADAVTEIQNGLATAAAVATVAGYIDTEVATIMANVASILATVDSEIAAILAKVNTLPANPAAVGSAMTLAADAVNASSLAASAVTEIQTGLATLASIAALNNLSAAQVSAEVVDALSVDTYAEPGSVPPATASIVAMVHWLFTLARNKRLTSATQDRVRNDADSADIGVAALSDDGTTFTRGEYA